MKWIYTILIILLLACNNSNKNSTNSSNKNTENYIVLTTDSLRVIENYFKQRHQYLLSYYDSLIYKFTPSVLNQEQLLRITESPSLYKMYKFFENHLNENITKHGEIILEFSKEKEKYIKGNKAKLPKQFLAKYFKLEEFYYKQFFKFSEKYKKWIYERKTNLSRTA